MNIEKIKYTLKHKKAFLKVEKELLGRNTIRGYLHDLDKVFMYTILSYETTRKFHKKYSRHHMRAKCKKDFIQQIIDWESANLTKEDKPLSAYETMISYYNNKIDIYEPIMNELGLVPQKGVLYSIIDKVNNQEVLSPCLSYDVNLDKSNLELGGVFKIKYTDGKERRFKYVKDIIESLDTITIITEYYILNIKKGEIQNEEKNN